MRHNDRSIFNHGGKKRRKPVLSKHDHLFKNEEDVVTVDKTDEVEDQKVSPQFRSEGYVRNIIKYNIKYTQIQNVPKGHYELFYLNLCTIL